MATTTFRILAGPSKSDLIGDLFFFRNHTHRFTLMLDNPPVDSQLDPQQVVSANIAAISGGQYAPLEVYRIELETQDGRRLQGHYSTKNRNGALALIEETEAWVVECCRNWVAVSEARADKHGIVYLHRGNHPGPFEVKVGGGVTNFETDGHYAFAFATKAEARTYEEDYRRSKRDEPQR